MLVHYYSRDISTTSISYNICIDYFSQSVSRQYSLLIGGYFGCSRYIHAKIADHTAVFHSLIVLETKSTPTKSDSVETSDDLCLVPNPAEKR